MIKAIKSTFFLLITLGALSANAQDNAWVKQTDNDFLLNVGSLNESLSNLYKGVSVTEIVFPNIDGKLEVFEIYDNAVLPKALAKKYPQVHSFKGVQKNNENKQIRFTCNTYGLEATLLDDDRILNLTRISGNNYSLVGAKSVPSFRQPFDCKTLGESRAKRQQKSVSSPSAKTLTSENIFRTIRLAVATTAETSAFFINKSGLQSASDAEKRAAVLAGVSTSINNMNVAFERDLGVRFNLIENNDELFFLNSNTDPFSSTNDLFISIDEGRIAIENRIPFSDYDMGHLITSRGNGGLASVGGICSDFKGDAVTGFREPEGFFFDFTLFAHELGHQLGGTHTQSAACEAESPVEVGSGTTIMGYSGACGVNDVQSESDPFFHSQSIEQIFEVFDFLETETSCGVQESQINNSLPVIPEINNYVIPVGALIYLDAEVTDADPDDNLTYSWEQFDQGFGAVSPPRSTSEFGPQFRVFPPIANSRRDFPTAGVDSKWEVLPRVERTMDFRLSVRDGRPGGIAISEIVQLTLVNNSEEFRVTSPSEAITFNQNEDRLITWNVANTNQPPFNVQNVKIEYSFDGGVSYPIILAEEVPNSGSTTIKTPRFDNEIPEDLANGKIRISALENAFYTVSSQPITLRSFPEITVVARQDLRENVLIFRIRSSFVAPKDIQLLPTFENTVTNQTIDLSDELLISTNEGLSYFSFNENNLVLEAGESEIWLAVPLRKANDEQNTLEQLALTIAIPDGSSNKLIDTEASVIEQVLSIDDNIVFTNPGKGMVTFTAKVRQLQDYNIDIYNINGALIKTILFGKNDQEFTLDALNTGLYIVRISLGGATAAKKLIVF